jgi:hypothetical protein
MKNGMAGPMSGSTAGRRWRATLAIAAAVPVAVWASIEAAAHADPAPPATSAPVPQPAPPPRAVSPPPADKLPESVIAPPAPPPPAPEPAGDPKKIEMGFALRVGGRLQGATATSKDSLNDFGLDEVYAEARFAGRLTPLFAWQFNLNALYDPATGVGAANIMDAIVKFEPLEELHLWAGRMLVPSDRSNLSGPWFISPWKYPGIDMPLPFPVGPRTTQFGRDNGVTAWGAFGLGKVTYYAGAFNLSNPAQSPLFSGRLNFCLIGSEPGYYHSSTYYGSQDIVAIAVGGQYQSNGQLGGSSGNNYSLFNADLLAEKNLGTGGVPTVEAGYYHYPNLFAVVGTPPTAAPAVKNFFYVLGSWLTPKTIGIGKLQPLVRWQQTTDPSWKILDAYVTYVIDEYFLRFAVGYEHSDFGAGTTNGNSILLGAQMQR